MSEHQRLEARSADGNGIQVRFVQLADRLGHQILILAAAAAYPVVSTLEGQPEDDFPASPPLQNLSLETIAGRPVGLLTGMAGRTHWSMSVEPSVDSPYAAVTFDVAVRTDVPVKQLGSRYSPLAKIDIVSTGTQSAALASSALDQLSLHVVPSREELSRTALRAGTDFIHLQPERNERQGSFRWKYTIRLSTGEGG